MELRPASWLVSCEKGGDGGKKEVTGSEKDLDSAENDSIPSKPLAYFD
jgi:hypothetical protein